MTEDSALIVTTTHDVEGRQISHPQQTQDKQGLSSDQPGIDVSSHRDAVEHAETGGTYAEDAAAKQRAEDPGAKQDAELTDE